MMRRSSCIAQAAMTSLPRGSLRPCVAGKGRREALEGLAARVSAPSLVRFCASVSEALSFGAPLAQTLERQADAIREEQRASVEQRIEEVPVRMLVPLGTLVVPAMLLAILGPLLCAALGG